VKDRSRIEAADLIVLNGLGIDNWVLSAVRGASGKKRIITVSSGLSNELIRVSGVPNPHIWLDPILAIRCVTNVAAVLSEINPEQAGVYAEKSAGYVKRLQQLDAEIREALLAHRETPIVTFHDSFPYFARRYGLNIVGVIEAVPDVAPSARQRGRLYATIRQKKAKCIFAEAQFPSRLADQIADDLNVPVATLNTMETGPLRPECYEEVMRENVRTLQQKLK
jgi:zinc transport system substrate-binding protein